MKPTVDKSTLTKRQIEVLEAIYHTGNPWRVKMGPRETPRFVDARGRAGGAVSRMIDELRSRHYIDHVPAQLTVKGLTALAAAKVPMLAISQVELDSRIEKRKRIEAETEEQRELDRQRREEARAKADAESRATRVAKLRDLLGQTECGHDFAEAMDDNELLAFCEKVADIETIY